MRVLREVNEHGKLSVHLLLHHAGVSVRVVSVLRHDPVEPAPGGPVLAAADSRLCGSAGFNRRSLLGLSILGAERSGPQCHLHRSLCSRHRAHPAVLRRALPHHSVLLQRGLCRPESVLQAIPHGCLRRGAAPVQRRRLPLRRLQRTVPSRLLCGGGIGALPAVSPPGGTACRELPAGPADAFPFSGGAADHRNPLLGGGCVLRPAEHRLGKPV